MLNALYQYAINNHLVSKQGFKPKNLKAYISLSKEGEFIGIDPVLKEKVLCPDIGSAAQGTTKSNVLVEKAEIVLLINPKKSTPTKHGFFKQALEEGSTYEPLFEVCLQVLNDEEKLEYIRQELQRSKCKPADMIGFKVDGQAIEQSERYLEWWDVFRKNQGNQKKNKVLGTRCLITGELSTPVEIVPKISGLRAVGGHSSGDSLICFDKNAYCSYNLSKAYNAPVSEKAVTIINGALTELIKKAPIHAGTKCLHWYQKTIKDQYDLILGLDLGFEAEVLEEEADEEPTDKETPIHPLIEVRKLLQSVPKGENPQQLENRYYILNLSAAGGRMMVRSYMEGSYEDLYHSFESWVKDLRLVLISGKGIRKSPKLFAIYTRLLKKEKGGGNIAKRIDEELGAIGEQIQYAIINNVPLPDSVAARALAYIRSDMVAGAEEGKGTKVPDGIACQILKAWLIRKNRDKEAFKMEDKLNPENGSSAYQAGRLMAVYAAIQKDALKDVGAGVIERYYASASTAPGLVIGKLATLSQYHLSKIENKGHKDHKDHVTRYNKMLEEISSSIGTSLPKTLNLEEQSQFALGYYQQTAHIYSGNENAK